MKETAADKVLNFLVRKTPYILFSYIPHDEECKNIQKNVLRLESKHFIFDVRSLLVSWEDMKAYFDLPKNIDAHTVFYIGFGYTVGLIQSPSFEMLEMFFLKCNQVIQIKDMVSEIYKKRSRIKTYTFQSTYSRSSPSVSTTYDISAKILVYDPDNKSKIRILSPTCRVYQLTKKLIPCNFFIN